MISTYGVGCVKAVNILRFFAENSKKYRVNSRNFGKTLDKLTKVVYMGK